MIRIPKAWVDMNPDEQQHWARYKAIILGDEVERLAFYNFQKVLRQPEFDHLGIVVLFCVEFIYLDKRDEGRCRNGGFDIIIISRTLRLIVHVELKLTLSRRFTIMKKHFNSFSEMLHENFPCGNNWTILNCYGFKCQQNEEICGNCKNNVLNIGDIDSIKIWWENIVATFEERNIEELVFEKIILTSFVMRRRKNLTRGEIRKHIFEKRNTLRNKDCKAFIDQASGENQQLLTFVSSLGREDNFVQEVADSLRLKKKQVYFVIISKQQIKIEDHFLAQQLVHKYDGRVSIQVTQYKDLPKVLCNIQDDNIYLIIDQFNQPGHQLTSEDCHAMNSTFQVSIFFFLVYGALLIESFLTENGRSSLRLWARRKNL